VSASANSTRKFVYETKEGDRIILGSQTWRVMRIDADRRAGRGPPAPGSKAACRFWARRKSAARAPEMLGESRRPLPRRNGKGGSEPTRQRAGSPALTKTSADTLKRELQNFIFRRRRPYPNWLIREHHFDEQAADNAIIYYSRQTHPAAPFPIEKQIVIEHFRRPPPGEPVIAHSLPTRPTRELHAATRA